MAGRLPMRLVLRLAVLAVVLLAVPAEARADLRRALVVGVSDHVAAGQAPGARQAAVGMSGLLAGLGFEVTLRIDPGAQALADAVDGFAAQAAGADPMLVYFAGPVASLGGESFLLGRDADVADPATLRVQGLGLQDVIDRMAAAGGAVVILVDPARGQPATAGGVSAVLGAAVPPARLPDGLLLALGPPDDQGGGGPSRFALALQQHLADGALPVVAALERVQADVPGVTVLSTIAPDTGLDGPGMAGDGVAVVVAQAPPAAQALDLLNLAMALPPGAARDIALLTLAETFPDTPAAAMAAPFVPPAGTPFRPPADDTLDARIAATLDMGQAREAGRRARQEAAARLAETRAAAIPAPEREAALALTPEALRDVQARLAALGFDPGTPDGRMGPATRAAVRAFQTSRAIAATGYLDAPTMAALDRWIAGAPRGYDGEWVIEVGREFLRNDGPRRRGDIENLAVIVVDRAGPAVTVRRSLMRTIAPPDPFGDLRVTLGDDGRLRVQGTISTHFPDARHVRPTLRRLSLDARLPAVFPQGHQVQFTGNRIDDLFRFHVTLRRARP